MLRTTLLLLALSTAAFAQDTSFLKSYSETRGFLMGRPVKNRLTPDAKFVLFLRSPARQKTQDLYQVDLATGQEKLLLAASALQKEENLSPEEKARRERQRVQAGGFADYWLDPAGSRVLVMLGGKLYVLERTSGKVDALAVAPSVLDPQWSPDGRKIAYVRNNDVFVYDLGRGAESQVTRGGTAEVTHGVAEFVAQEEMKRHRGYWWSPDSRSIAFTEADHRGVEIWNISDPSKPDVAPSRQYYPRPGKANVKVRLGITPIDAYKPLWVEWDRKKFEYLGSVRWDRQGPLTVQLQDRSQQLLSLQQVDPGTGKTRVLYEERDPRWVNLFQEVPVWLPGAKQCLVMKADRLELLTPATGQTKNVVPHEVTEFVAYDDKRQRVHCRIDPGPGDPRAWAGDLTGTEVVTSPWRGVTELGVAKGADLRVITIHTLEHLPQTVVVDDSGKERARLKSVAEEPALAPNVEFAEAGDLRGVLVRPRNFVPGRRYPVVLDVYGGPHHLHVQHARRNWLVDQWLADQGFIVVSVDNRGTPGRGVEFERAVYGKFGSVPIEDQVRGLQELGKRFPELDLSRVGVFGWSFGGYLSAQSVLKRPDVFRAAVAGAPVTDWLDYDTHYTERYLGLLPGARQAYEESSLLPLAPKLERPLLLVHGTADDNVYYRNTLRLADALFRAGRPFETLPLPGITHSYTADAVATERLWARIAGFFREHLK